jgi:hypothetical protein
MVPNHEPRNWQNCEKLIEFNAYIPSLLIRNVLQSYEGSGPLKKSYWMVASGSWYGSQMFSKTGSNRNKMQSQKIKSVFSDCVFFLCKFFDTKFCWLITQGHSMGKSKHKRMPLDGEASRSRSTSLPTARTMQWYYVYYLYKGSPLHHEGIGQPAYRNPACIVPGCTGEDH